MLGGEAALVRMAREETENCKRERGDGAASAGRDKMRSGPTWPCWTRCQRCTASTGSTWCACSGDGRPPKARFSSFSIHDASLTARLHGDQTKNLQLHRANNLNGNCRPMYQLQFLFRTHALILNQTQVISSQSKLVSTVSGERLSEIC